MAKRAQKGFELAAKPESPEITEEQWQALEVLRQSNSKGGAAHALNVSPHTLAKRQEIYLGNSGFNFLNQ